MSDASNVQVHRIVSGGQTGVDRGALDAAIEIGLAHGGWCPRGRLAEDGVIPSRYELRETASSEYPVRTEQNVLDSDGTLILYWGKLQGGTELTYRLARKHGKPWLLVDLMSPVDASRVRQWLSQHQVAVLNVAGPRESSRAGIAALTRRLLNEVLQIGAR
jgi:hypothetical protein